MTRLANGILVCRALCELLRYDLLSGVGGFPLVARRMRTSSRSGRAATDPAVSDICRAVDWAMCLYWKRVMCLQKSVATARLLRRRQLDAKVVVGCRPDPFFSHAWVEIEGRVINDSPVYKVRLPALLQL